MGLAYLEQRLKGRLGPPRLPADDLYLVYVDCPSTPRGFRLDLHGCTTMAYSKVLFARRECAMDVRECPIPLQHPQYRKRSCCKHLNGNRSC